MVLQGHNYGGQTAANGVDPLANPDGSGWPHSAALDMILQGRHYGKGKNAVT